MSSTRQRRRRRESVAFASGRSGSNWSESGVLSGTVVHLENLGSEAFVHIGS